MKRLSSIFFLLAFAAVVFAGDAQVNFSGEWNLNKDKSDQPSGRRRGRTSAFKMTVTQKDNNLTVERIYKRRNGQKRTITEKFTLDGKKCTNEIMNRKRTSTVEWAKDGKSLIINSTMNFERQGQNFEITSSEKWSLANGGKSLLIESTIHAPRGDRSRKTFYDKATTSK